MTEHIEAQVDSYMKCWQEEQIELASQVIVLPDEQTIPEEDRFLRREFNSTVTARINDTTARYYFGGVDVSFPEDPGAQSIAVYVIIDAVTLQIVYQDWEYFDLTVPYIPSFLAFREIDPLQRLVEKQQRHHPQWTPSAILVDGNGILHPRGAGIACFLGVRTGIPTIGIGKTLFNEGGLNKSIVWHGIVQSLTAAVADMSSKPSTAINEDYFLYDRFPITPTPIDSREHAADESSESIDGDRKTLVQQLPRNCRGLSIPLQVAVTEQKQPEQHRSPQKPCRVLGSAVVGHGGRMSRAEKTCIPIFVSVGHLLSLQRGVDIVVGLSLTRIPEPVRQADILGRRLLRERQQQQRNKLCVQK